MIYPFGTTFRQRRLQHVRFESDVEARRPELLKNIRTMKKALLVFEAPYDYATPLQLILRHKSSINF